MPDRLPRHPSGVSYTEALAHWRLHVQTAVKRASTLPTAMFDVCDATLEARLTAATEGLFQRLLDHDVPPSNAALAPELQIEDVLPDELRRMQRELVGSPATDAPDLTEGSRAEHLAILTEIACTGEGVLQTRAAQALAAELDPHGPAALDQLATRLAGDLARALADQDAPTFAGIEHTCRQVVGNVLAHLQRVQNPGAAR